MGWLYDWGRLSAPRVNEILGFGAGSRSGEHRTAGGSHPPGRESAPQQPRSDAVKHLPVAAQGLFGVQPFGQAGRGGQLGVGIDGLERRGDPRPVDAADRELTRQGEGSAAPPPPPYKAARDRGIVYVAELGEPHECALDLRGIVAATAELPAQLEARVRASRQPPQAADKGRRRRRGLGPGGPRTPPFHRGCEHAWIQLRPSRLRRYAPQPKRSRRRPWSVPSPPSRRR